MQSAQPFHGVHIRAPYSTAFPGQVIVSYVVSSLPEKLTISYLSVHIVTPTRLPFIQMVEPELG
jgi:hypothetical protein